MSPRRNPSRAAAQRKAEIQARLERVLWDAVVDLAGEGYDHDDVDGIVSDVFREMKEAGR